MAKPSYLIARVGVRRLSDKRSYVHASADAPAKESGFTRSLAATVAKWLVPSTTALFAVTGYLATAAQQRLLGVALPTDGAVYASSATEFFGELPRLLSETLEALLLQHRGEIFGPHALLWSISIFVALLAIALHPLQRRFFATARAELVRALSWGPPIALALLLVGKFVVLDTPLGEIHDVVLSQGSSTSPGIGEEALKAAFSGPADPASDKAVTFTIRTREVQQTFAAQMAQAKPSVQERKDRPLSSWYRGRTEQVWAEVLCSRIAFGAAGGQAQASDKIMCHGSRDQDLWGLRGEFLAHLGMASLIAIVAVSLLRAPRSGPGLIAFAVLSLIYCLTVANAYGKLLMPTDFDFGVVRLAKPPTVVAPTGQPPSQSEGLTPTRHRPAREAGPSNATAAIAEPEMMDGLILGRGASGTELLVLERGDCALSQPSASRPSQYAAVRLAWLSNAQVLSVQEIFRQDAITWAVLSEVTCLPADIRTHASNH